MKQPYHRAARDVDTPRNPDGRMLMVLIAAGILVRVGLAAVSRGSNDSDTFMRLGQEVGRWGLLATYQQDADLNHPPLPSLWAAAAYRLAPQPVGFSFVFKLPSILADAASAWLLWKIVKGRRLRAHGSEDSSDPSPPERGRRAAASGDPAMDHRASTGALAVAAMYVWSLDAILVSGYHCDIAPVYASLCLLAVYLMVDPGRYFLGGLALALAINVKLMPLLLIPPLLLHCRDWKQGARFIAGLSLGALPFLPILLGPAGVWQAFRNNALNYKSFLDKWGIEFFLLPNGPNNQAPAGFDWNRSAAVRYYDYGRYLILALVALWSVSSRFLGRWSLYEVAAVTLAIFLILAPGFGVQYTIVILPMLFAIRPRWANVYGIAAGLFLLAVYFLTWPGEFPLDSEFDSFFPLPSPWFGLAAWIVLIAYVVTAIARPALRIDPKLE